MAARRRVGEDDRDAQPPSAIAVYLAAQAVARPLGRRHADPVKTHQRGGDFLGHGGDSPRLLADQVEGEHRDGGPLQRNGQ